MGSLIGPNAIPWIDLCHIKVYSKMPRCINRAVAGPGFQKLMTYSIQKLTNKIMIQNYYKNIVKILRKCVLSRKNFV